MSQPMLHAHPSAVIVITVHHDTITQCARVVLGESHTVSRTWQRIGRGLWQSHDPEFIEAEDRIGPELAEYLDGLDLPTDVADLLPRPAQNPGEGFARALEEVRRG